jgi:hypothetical protein
MNQYYIAEKDLQLYEAANNTLREIGTNMFYLKYTESDIHELAKIFGSYSKSAKESCCKFFNCLVAIAKFRLSDKEKDMAWNIFIKYYHNTEFGSLYEMTFNEDYELT